MGGMFLAGTFVCWLGLEADFEEYIPYRPQVTREEDLSQSTFSPLQALLLLSGDDRTAPSGEGFSNGSLGVKRGKIFTLVP